MTSEHEIADDHRRIRRDVLIRRVLDTLRDTVQIDEDRVHFTDASVRVIGPLAEAVDILEAIVFASDGCAGHAHCLHSMEPWQRARALLEGKWTAEMERQPWP